MHERERQSDERIQKKQKRSKGIGRRSRNRRKKKLLRALSLALMAVIGIILLILILGLGRFAIECMTTGEMELPWGLGEADIILDAGHGGKDQGASYGEVLEKELTLEIAKKTKEILEEAGYRVSMTRKDDTFVDLYDRADYANRKNSKVFVSIHCNSSEEDGAEGIETFYAASKEEESQALAQALQTGMVEQTEARDRGIKTADYVVIKETDMPAALVEVGFLSDSGERQLLQQEEYQKKLAEGIAAGILEYLEDTSEQVH